MAKCFLDYGLYLNMDEFKQLLVPLLSFLNGTYIYYKI